MQKVMKNNLTIEDYYQKFNGEKQERLRLIQYYIRRKFPYSIEKIHCGIPTIERDGKIILHYAAYKKHISLIIGYELTEYFQAKYPQYKYTQATLILNDDLPIPIMLLEEILEEVAKNG